MVAARATKDTARKSNPFTCNLFMSATSRPAHHGRHEVLDRGRADLLHGAAQFGAQDCQDAFDARLAERAEPPQIGPPDRYALGVHAERLGDVGAAAETG